jgi:hypothetical protein
LSDKLNLFIALGPVITLIHSHDKFIGSISKHEKKIKHVFEMLDIHELMGKNWNEIKE